MFLKHFLSVLNRCRRATFLLRFANHNEVQSNYDFLKVLKNTDLLYMSTLDCSLNCKDLTIGMCELFSMQ